MTDNTNDQSGLLALTSDIVSAHFSKNEVAPDQAAGVIQNVYETLAQLAPTRAVPEVQQQPAVSVRASIRPDYLVCLEDGKKLKMLKRYIRTNYNLTPAEYGAKWGPPDDYPMAAPNYAEQRRNLVVSIGLGTKNAVKSPRKPVRKANRMGNS